MSRRCSSLWDRWACLTVGQMENVSVFDSLTSQVAMSNIWNNSGGATISRDASGVQDSAKTLGKQRIPHDKAVRNDKLGEGVSCSLTSQVAMSKIRAIREQRP